MTEYTLENPLADFVDPNTMKHVREYPHPIDLVWEAVTTGEHLDVWLVRTCNVERRLGGACSFTWGAGPEEAMVGTVTEWDPPRAVQYTLPVSSLRFELEPIDGGTRLVFIHAFAPGTAYEEPEDAYPGADKPAGPGTPWAPGFVAGFHAMLDDLAVHLRGDFEARHPSEMTAKELWLVDLYRDHIARKYPR